MIDLKNPKWEEFDIIEMPKHELKSGQKVRCTFFRIKPGNHTLRREHYKTTELPKEIFDGHLQTGVIIETDFLITNKDGKTTFQFRTPSEGGVEL